MAAVTSTSDPVVRTARTSEKAAEGQNATLEFILVNHPLDCPVCDKGGECPLQDLTFRYGPGSTRMSFEKLTFEKPIPISPTISLDRERCILCYRCTRFSESVSEDGQLVAANRGAMSVITTFEDEPYSGPFTGNVTELCPVGALLPTQYRFEARPWEIVNVPTVCGLCPVGCNVNATVREGKVKRIQSRNHPEIETEDTAEGLITYRNGVKSVFFATNNFTYNAPVVVETHCENGTALMEFDRAVITYKNGKELTVVNDPTTTLNEANFKAFFNQDSAQIAAQTLKEWGVVRIPITWKAPKAYWGVTHNKQIENFYASLDKDIQPDITAEVTIKTQELICAIYQSAKEGRNIELQPRFAQVNHPNGH